MSFHNCTPSDGQQYVIRSVQSPLSCLILPDNGNHKRNAQPGPSVVVADCSTIQKPDAWVFNKTTGTQAGKGMTSQFIRDGSFLAATSSGIFGVGWPDNTVQSVWLITPMNNFQTFGCGIISLNTSSTIGVVVKGKNSLTLSDSTPPTLIYDTFAAKPNQEWILQKWDDVINLNY